MTRNAFLTATSSKIDELVHKACPGVKHPGLLVALSGGPDSVALLLAARNWSLSSGSPVEAVHLNHMLRGDASAEDASFCQDLCSSLDIILHLKEEDPRPASRLRGMGLEEAGRTLRLAFFGSVLAENPHLHCVAKGHHKDDQAETVIMRMFRGTGADGLGGIRPVAGNSIHPLLDFSRADILAFLSETNQPWRTDASNLDGDNIRARLRRELLPLVRDIFGEGCGQTPARLGELLGHDQDFLSELAGQAAAELVEENGGVPGLLVPGVLKLPTAVALRVVRRWLITSCRADSQRIEFSHVMNILAWLREGQSGSGLDLPGGLRVVRDFDVLRPGPDWQGQSIEGSIQQSAADYRILVDSSGPVKDPVTLGLDEGSGTQDDRGNWNLSCPADVLEGNLKVRNPQPGDRFQPFGLDGTRKLSDLFREQRIPDYHREGALLVEDEGGILWVVGLARSERTRLLPSTGKIVTICVARR